MAPPQTVDALAPPTWEVVASDAHSVLRLAGDWIVRETGLRGPRDIDGVMTACTGARLCFDTGGVGRWDSAVVVFIQQLDDAARRRTPPLPLDGSGLPDAVRQLLSLAASTEERPSVAGRPPSLPVRIGRWALGGMAELLAVATLVGDTVLRGSASLVGRTQTRAVDVLHLMAEAGAGALGIVAIVNALVGAILAFVGAVQLRRFGAGIYIADLIGIATIREMAAVMTAVVMAGRTGGAYAAHIATMQGNEEIDALKALGIPVYDFLVLPRVAALMAMMPLLYLYACAVGLLGGLVVSLATLDLTTISFLNELLHAVAGRQFLIGLVKSIAFGALIALAGCRIGLKAGRSAADVGRAATTAVVVGIVGVIALDAVFAVCADALGI
ncbi:MAG TPA: ABC transporter permease [Rhodopila sp.]|nr:ABC transporter permease [Rhodopila sp.]